MIFLGLAIYDRLGEILHVLKSGDQTAGVVMGAAQTNTEGVAERKVDADGFETKVLDGYSLKVRPGSGGYIELLLADGSVRPFANEDRILPYFRNSGR